MNPWPFIVLAYALAILGTSVLVYRSFAAMRRAEREADAVRGDR